MIPTNEILALADCPIGLFYSDSGEICLKTEYSNNEGRIDAYIASSGEFFWGGANSVADQRKVLVRPVDLDFANSALRLAATPSARDVREALEPFANCVFNDNGDVTIDTSNLRTRDYMKAKTAIASLDAPAKEAAAPAAGGDAEPVAWRWHWNFGDEPDVWAYSETPVTSDKDKTAEPLYAAPPLQAPALIASIRVRIKKIDDLLHPLAPKEPNADEAHGEIHDLAYEFEQVVSGLQAPAVSEADVGQTIPGDHFSVREFREDEFRSMEVQICGETKTVQFCCADHGGDHPTEPAVALPFTEARHLIEFIQSAAQGGGTEGGEA